MKLKFKSRRLHIAFFMIALVLIAYSVGLVLTLLQKGSLAHTGNLYYSASNHGRVDKGSDISYTIRLAPGTAVDTITATLNYDPAKLAYKSVSYRDSPFNVQIPAVSKTGSLMIQSAKFNGLVTQDSFVASVVLTSLDGGLPSVTFTGNAARAGIATNPSINGTTDATSKSIERVTPWLIGIVANLVIGIALILIIRRRKHTLQSNNHKNIQENTKKSDGTV